MTTWDYISTGLGIGAVFAVFIGAWALIEWATNPSPSSRVIQSPRAHTRVLEAQPMPLPEPITDTAWELISHADVKLFLSQSVWEEVTKTSSSTLLEGSAPALPDTTPSEVRQYRTRVK